MQRAYQFCIPKGYNIPITGIFDSETTAIVRKFQKESNLTVDAKVGPLTRKALLK